MDVDVEIRNLKELCLRLVDADDPRSFSPLLCVPSTQQLAFMMDHHGPVEASTVRAWAKGAATNSEYLLAFQVTATQLQIDAVSGPSLTTTRFALPNSRES